MAMPLEPGSMTVHNYSTQVLPENPRRRGAVLTNVGPGSVSLGLGHEAVLDRGITLVPGAAWSMEQLNVSTSQINAIATGGNATVAIQEWE